MGRLTRQAHFFSKTFREGLVEAKIGAYLCTRFWRGLPLAVQKKKYFNSLTGYESKNSHQTPVL
jgi:hypothetical protein